jgi:hypothetical protein
MAITQTTLTAAIQLGDLTLPVNSATGFTVGNWVRIDSEYIGAVLAVNGTQISVRGRGDQGTAAVPHNALALVATGLSSDYPGVPPGISVPDAPDDEVVVEYGVSGAIAVPSMNTIVTLNKAGVAVMTLAAPSKAQDGLRLTVTSLTANAHTVTATGLFKTGAATVNLATFAAFAGVGFSAVALNGLWVITSNNVVTFT